MNTRLTTLFKQDQKDRNFSHGEKEDWDEIKKRDLKRRKEVQSMLHAGEIKTGKDFWSAAMIFQHGPAITHTKKSKSLAKKSMQLGYKKAGWMYAAATDRLLVREGKKQKYGTQFYRKSPKGKWFPHPVNTKTTDEEREALGVPSISKTSKIMNER